MPKSKLLLEWEAARDDLGLDIVAPYVVSIGSNVRVCVELLLKHFGGRNGMLVLTDYGLLKPYEEQIVSLGYGYSVLSEPRGEAGKTYCREVFIDMLSDWSWTGAKNNRPEWLLDEEFDQE